METVALPALQKLTKVNLEKFRSLEKFRKEIYFKQNLYRFYHIIKMSLLSHFVKGSL